MWPIMTSLQTKLYGNQRQLKKRRKRRGLLVLVEVQQPTLLPACFIHVFIIIIYPLTKRVVGAPQMISQPVSSILPCSPLPSGTWRTPGLSTSWCCSPIPSSVCLVFFPLSLCLARWFWPDLMNGRHVHTTAVCTWELLVILTRPDAGFAVSVTMTSLS